LADNVIQKRSSEVGGAFEHFLKVVMYKVSVDKISTKIFWNNKWNAVKYTKGVELDRTEIAKNRDAYIKFFHFGKDVKQDGVARRRLKPLQSRAARAFQRRRLSPIPQPGDSPGVRVLRRRRLKPENRPIHRLLREIREANGLPREPPELPELQ